MMRSTPTRLRARLRRPLGALAVVPLAALVLAVAATAQEAASESAAPAATPSPSPSDIIPPQAPAGQPAEQPAAKAACCAPACCMPCRPRCRLLGRRARGCCVPCCPCCGPAAACEAQAGQPADPPEAEQPKPDPYAWKDLFDGKTLKGWKETKFGGEGKVEVKDGMVVMEMGNDMTGITWAGEVPRTNYELTLEGMRLGGNDFFCTTTFPVGKDPCTLVVGGWGGTIVGLSNVDYYDASDNPTTKFMEFKNNKWYKVRLRVSDAKIEGWIDDEKLVNQPRADHKFDIRFEVELSKPLGISTWQTTGAVRNIRIRKLKPEEVEQAAKEAEKEKIGPAY